VSIKPVKQLADAFIRNFYGSSRETAAQSKGASERQKSLKALPLTL
jgi:hypothetical protein